ncbi:hypothetical protein TNCV_2307631 [Trichonephila clavipes]|nr:hypothetical protein TNCV_2307631 [Trichonephila clavipes]
MRYRSGEFASQGRMSKPVNLVKVSSATCGLALSCWNTVLSVPCNKDRTKWLHNLCDVAVSSQTAINVFQRYTAIKCYATSKYDARFETDLTLGEMSWFVDFSAS